MTEFVFNTSDLNPGSPRVLPAPLVAGAIFLNNSYHFTQDAEEFLDDLGVVRATPKSRWMVLVWDLRDGEENVAQASFAWTGTELVLEGMLIDEDYRAINLESYLMETGSALFGGLEVQVPRADDDQRSA
jgi:hypothetical protein